MLLGRAEAVFIYMIEHPIASSLDLNEEHLQSSTCCAQILMQLNEVQHRLIDHVLFEIFAMSTACCYGWYDAIQTYRGIQYEPQVA
jgi:hypothetical protein